MENAQKSPVISAAARGFVRFRAAEITFFLILLYRILKESWICDDAYHAFIMVRNLVGGNGFVYNIGERVNASTCPFYTLIVALFYAVSGNMYFSGTISCILFSAAAIWILLFCVCKKRPFLTALAGMILFFDRSFISFTTSGLENAMLFFLGALFCLMLFGGQDDKKLTMGKLIGMALTVGISAGTRMDSVLIYAPVCIAVYFFGAFTEIKWYKRWLAGFAGLSPFIAWLIFSAYYYGFPFPNTAYAKLNTGFPLYDYIIRGLRYIKYSFLYSPTLLIMIALFLITAFVSKKKKHIFMASGIAAYMLYLIRIGGDFMVGRHFTLCFFISVLGLADMAAHSDIAGKLVAWLASFPKMQDTKKTRLRMRIAFLAGLAVFCFAGSRYHYILPFDWQTGIADEREFYFDCTSLARYIESGGDSIRNLFNNDTFSGKGGYAEFASGIAMYYEAHGKNYFDEHGLGDALIARLPSRYNPNWRIGHMRRTIPLGYSETVQTGTNMIENRHLAEYYDKLKQIISGDLNSPERIRLIIDFNLGKYNYLLEQYREESRDLKVYYESYEEVAGY